MVPQARLCKHANSLLAWFPVIVLLLQKEGNFQTPGLLAKHTTQRS